MALPGPYFNNPYQLIASQTTRSDLSCALFGEGCYEECLGKQWHRVTSSVNWVGNKENYWVSMGSTLDREIIFFDETKISTLKEQAVHACRHQPIDRSLMIVCNLINQLTHVPGEDHQVTELNLDKKLKALLEECHTIKSKPICLFMEELMALGILVCRHKALLSSALLRHLTEQKILPQGSVRQYRATLPNGGAHTWTVYRDFTNGQIWICDPRGRQVRNVHHEFDRLASIYSHHVLGTMVQRLDAQDIYFPLQEKMMEYSNLPFSLLLLRNDQGLHLGFQFNTQGNVPLLAKVLGQQNIVSTFSSQTVTISFSQNPKLLMLDIARMIDDYTKMVQSITPSHPTLGANNPFVAQKNVPFQFEDIDDWVEFLQKDVANQGEFFTQHKIFGRFNQKPTL